MMASNQPYHKVDDGIGGGFVGGAMLGSAVVAGAQYGGAAMVGSLQGKAIGAARQLRNAQADVRYQTAAHGPNAVSDKMETRRNLYSDRFNRYAGDAKKWGGRYNKAFGAFGGGWKGKAVAYGAGALGMGILGAAADAMSD
ncbi:hypothetical protein [Paenibacillus sp. UNC496MF]|uniref:hypothetical protein n=1 Tax=Paenibacillus sp. UNC496MF TaxID=1502753 RepID=UPI000B86E009|nr:hypothetical protein [Paenibacillus sp. UNC496MF]